MNETDNISIALSRSCMNQVPKMKCPKKLDYTIYPKEKLIVEQYTGAYTCSDLMAFKLHTSQNKHYNKHLTVISDLRKIKIKATLAEVDAYVKELKMQKTQIAPRTCILLTAEPEQVTFSTLCAMSIARIDLPLKIVTCSSISYISDLLDISPARIAYMLNTPKINLNQKFLVQ